MRPEKNFTLPIPGRKARVTDVRTAMFGRLGDVLAIEYGDWTKREGTQVVLSFADHLIERYTADQLIPV